MGWANLGVGQGWAKLGAKLGWANQGVWARLDWDKLGAGLG